MTSSWSPNFDPFRARWNCPPAGPEGVDFFWADLNTCAMPRTDPPLSTAMLDAAIELIGKTGRLGSVAVTGFSMLPTFAGVEHLAVEFSPAKLAFGDVVVFRQRENLVVHRLVQRRPHEGALRLRTRGDGKIAFDPWVDPAAVIGRVVAVGYPDGSWRNLRNFRARCYARAIAAHGLVWGGLGAIFMKFGGRSGADWRWRLGRLDQWKLRLAHAVLFRVLHPVVPAPDFAGSDNATESAEAKARCYTPARKK